MNHSRQIYISGAKRTAIGKFRGMYKNTSATKLGSSAIKAALHQASIKTVDLVTMGCVLPAGLGQAPARQAALGAGLDIHTPCVTVNKMCGSGLQAVIQTCDAIRAGSIDCGVAGGMENMTRAGEEHMMVDGLEDAYDKGKSMGCFAELCVEKYNFSREDQDAFAAESLQRAQDATAKGSFDNEIIAMTVEGEICQYDEGPKRVSKDKIKLLKPAFKDGGTVTAANSSSISDGAAALVLTTDCQKPLARIVDYSTYAQEPAWFTTAPIFAIRQLLEKINWQVDDVDLFEINEAFAVVTMITMQELNIPYDKVNIHGGACVLGHPIGATGARILVTLLYALQSRGLKRGVASLCIGGGEAQAIAIEIMS